MKVTVVHTFYQQPGGEDQVFTAEVDLLRQSGIDVSVLEFHNNALDRMSTIQKVKSTIWNTQSVSAIRDVFRQSRPDVIHFHNTFPLLSPAVLHAAKHSGAAVVQTLHNYRLFCLNGTFFREGRVCQKCLGKLPLHGIRHRCYRENLGASATVATMIGLHRALGTWVNKVDLYIALTEFARDVFISGGLPIEKTVVKPNFIKDPGFGQGGGGYALFVGRLSTEKGIRLMLEAWKNVPLPLKIVGDGAEANLVMGSNLPNVEWLGWQPRETVAKLMQRAEFLVFPSQWFEGFPMTIVEAYATGLPVLATKLGSMATLIRHGITGLHFEVGNSLDLAKQARVLMDNPSLRQSMRQSARLEYETKYTPEKALKRLLSIYQHAINLNRENHEKV